jgi:hypothetical protein
MKVVFTGKHRHREGPDDSSNQTSYPLPFPLPALVVLVMQTTPVLPAVLLSLGELESFTGAGLTRFFALFHSGVASQEAFLLQHRTHRSVMS